MLFVQNTDCCGAERIRNSLVAALETSSGIGCARLSRLGVLWTYLTGCANGEHCPH